MDTTYYHVESTYGQYEGGHFSDGYWMSGSSVSPCIDAGQPGFRPTAEPSRNGAVINMGAYGNTATAAKSPPIAVAIRAAADIHPTYARLRGELLTAGDPDVTVTFYWGTTDGGTDPQAWATNATLPALLNAPGLFSLLVHGLEQQTYYYTCLASNAAGGTAWAATTNFTPVIAAPYVINRGVENEAGPVVTLKGEITETGGDVPQVFVCWGAWEGSQSTSSWQHVVSLGLQDGVFETEVSIAADTGYYYTCYAVNAAGDVWAPAPNLPFGATVVRYVNPGAGGTGSGYNWANGYATLAEALAACRDDRTNVIYLVGGTYTLNQSLLLTNSHVALRGGYSGAMAGIDAPGVQDPAQWETIITRNPAVTDMRLFKAAGVADILIDGITFTGGRLLSSENGSAIYLSAASDVTVRNCQIKQNGVYGWGVGYTTYGAGIFAENSIQTVIADCNVSGNTGGAGGGVYVTGGSAILTNCVIRNNQANIGWSGGGGGVSCVGAAVVDLYDCVISGNYALPDSGNGGGLNVSGGANARLKNCLVTYNDSIYGDGLRVTGATLKLENCTVFGNKGSGVYAPNTADTLMVTNSILWGNGTDVLLGGGWQGHTFSFSHSLFGNGAETVVPTCFSADPRCDFPHGYYLAANSPAVDAGGSTAADAGLAGYTTRADETLDSGVVDMGYHYPTGVLDRHLYVAPTGNDTWAGTAQAPLKTITHAFAVAQGRETIHLAAGTYTPAAGELFPLIWEYQSKGLTLIGTNSALTRISAVNGSTRLLSLTAIPGFVLENITLADANYRLHATGGVGILADRVEHLAATHCVFANLRVGWDGWHNQYGPAIYQIAGACFLQDCVFSNNVAETRGRGGAVCSLNAKLSANRCVFSGNSAIAGLGGALYLEGGSMGLTNVLAAGNAAGETGDGIYVASGTLAIEKVTLAHNDGVGLHNAGGTVAARNSILWGNGIDVTGTVAFAYCDIGTGENIEGPGCISLDPVFADQTFCHLQSRKGHYRNGYFAGGSWVRALTNSPALDRGDPASAYDHEPQPNHKRINLGAYGNTTVATLSDIPTGTMILLQ